MTRGQRRLHLALWLLLGPLALAVLALGVFAARPTVPAAPGDGANAAPVVGGAPAGEAGAGPGGAR